MKLDGITINVGVAISEETVRRCVQILNMYLTDNPDLTIKVYDDKYHDHVDRFMQFEPKENESEAK